MIRSYILSLVLLFVCATSSQGMVPGGVDIQRLQYYSDTAISRDLLRGGWIKPALLAAGLAIGVQILKVAYFNGKTPENLHYVLPFILFPIVFGCIGYIENIEEGYPNRNAYWWRDIFRCGYGIIVFLDIATL